MDERTLLVLGLLKSQRQHGYQINEFIEQYLGQVSEMKKATAYALLKRLHEQGYVEVATEQAGKRPQRQVYSLTRAGEDAFLTMLRAHLADAKDLTPIGEIGLMFLDHLPEEEVVHALESRLEKIAQLISSYEQTPPHAGIGVALSVEHRLTLLRCEQAWLGNTIKRLSARITALH